MTVGPDDIAAGVERLGLGGLPVGIHVSLRSFGGIVGGPATLVNGLLAEGCTVLIPTMAGQLFAIPAPPDDRPERNGRDYAEKDALAAAEPWPGQSDVYDASRTEVDAWLGTTPAYVAARPDRHRAASVPGAFSAVGPLAADLIAADEARDQFGPLRALVDRDGWVVLMGVSLTSMTLLHLSEVEAGRTPFVYWALGADRQPVRTLGGGCSMGFDALAPVLAPVERTTDVGSSRWRAFPARDVIRLAAAAIRADPDVMRCANAECLECRDAAAGGPILL
ncbi:MAG TPA: AAC(3) family N-acetyltransferase [Acidimicrobiales bacterium]|nr:AAC(3) family N-acetyltransferase [Acidimicrobiales bacterium]